MASSGLTASEKLTIEALKQHDKVHPSFKAKKTVSSKGRKEVASNAESGTHGRRSVRVSASYPPLGGHPLPSPGSRTAANFSVFQVVHATQTWKRFTQRRRSPNRHYNFENTFRTEPRDGERFLPRKVESIIKRLLESTLENVVYSPDECKELAKNLSGQIKDRVKVLNIPRFRIVCNVIIAENHDQGMQIASRCVWNPETDNFASYTYKNPSLVATAYVHGVYLE